MRCERPNAAATRRPCPRTVAGEHTAVPLIHSPALTQTFLSVAVGHAVAVSATRASSLRAERADTRSVKPNTRERIAPVKKSDRSGRAAATANQAEPSQRAAE